MVAKIETKVFLITFLIYLGSKTSAQENATTPSNPESKNDPPKETVEKTVKESLVLQASRRAGYFTPSFGPPKRVPKSEGSFYTEKTKPYQPVYVYHSTYYIKPSSYYQPAPHYHPQEGKYRGYDHGYRKYPQGYNPRYKKPWGTFPHYDVPQRGYHHRPVHYRHYDGYTGGFGGTPGIYPSPEDITVHNYEVIKVHHDFYEERNDEKDSAKDTPQNSTEKAMEEVKDTIILIPENKETKRQVEATTTVATTTTTTTAQTKNVTEAVKPTR